MCTDWVLHNQNGFRVKEAAGRVHCHSGRIHGEFLRLLYIPAYRRTLKYFDNPGGGSRVWRFTLRFVLPGVGLATPGQKAVMQSPLGPKVFPKLMDTRGSIERIFSKFTLSVS